MYYIQTATATPKRHIPERKSEPHSIHHANQTCARSHAHIPLKTQLTMQRIWAESKNKKQQGKMLDIRSSHLISNIFYSSQKPINNDVSTREKLGKPIQSNKRDRMR